MQIHKRYLPNFSYLSVMANRFFFLESYTNSDPIKFLFILSEDNDSGIVDEFMLIRIFTDYFLILSQDWSIPSKWLQNLIADALIHSDPIY